MYLHVPNEKIMEPFLLKALSVFDEIYIAVARLSFLSIFIKKNFLQMYIIVWQYTINICNMYI